MLFLAHSLSQPSNIVELKVQRIFTCIDTINGKNEYMLYRDHSRKKKQKELILLPSTKKQRWANGSMTKWEWASANC